VSLCLLLPDSPITPPDQLLLLPDEWICGGSPGPPAASSGAAAVELGEAAPGVSLSSAARVDVLSSDLAEG
jgi:hypothetical protein